jgi:hypothetical protein
LVAFGWGLEASYTSNFNNSETERL